MVLSKLAFFALIFPISSFASKLPEFATKQDVTNLRFISKDGKFTYYQRSNGEFLLSTNFAVTKALSYGPGTNFEVYSSPTRKYVIVSADESFHTFYSMKKVKKLHLIEYGSSRPENIGQGQSPRLHQKDEIASFYDPYNKTITFLETKFRRVISTIKMTVKSNPYFRPNVVMIDSTQILYTDINSSGNQAVLLLNRKENKTKVLFKTEAPTFKIELCENDDTIFMGEFPYQNVEGEVIISKIEKSKFDIAKRDILYTSKTNDIGNILCNYEGGKIAFIKEVGAGKTELAEIDLATKNIKILSDLGHVSSAINIDQRLLIPHYGKTYLVKGDNNIPLVDTLETPKKEDNAEEEAP